MLAFKLRCNMPNAFIVSRNVLYLNYGTSDRMQMTSVYTKRVYSSTFPFEDTSIIF